MRRLAFRGLSQLLVTLTGNGDDRSAGINNLHHKLSHRLFKLAPSFGIQSEEQIDLDQPVRISLRYDARDGGVGHKFLMYRQYEPNITRVVSAILRPEMHVWNIGANLGYYTVLTAKLTKHVTAFEPHPKNAARLRKNVKLNELTNVAVIEAALAEGSGSLTFYESSSNTGDHRITNEAGRSGITVRAQAASEAVAEYGAPDLIIMDVQGAEGIILRSLRDTISERKPAMVFEFWPEGLNATGSSGEEVEEMLHALGYQVWRIDAYRSSLLRVEPGRIAQNMRAGEETNLLALPKGAQLPPAISKSLR